MSKPKDILNLVNKKSGKKISEKDVHKLASGVNPGTIQNEAQLRQLIHQVSQMAGVPVSEQTVNEIVRAVKQSGMNPNNLQQMMSMMMGKR